MRRLSILLALFLVAGSVKRLSDAEQAHFYALRPYMEPADEKEYLKLKTEADRDAWLKAHGLWNRFNQHNVAVRDQSVAGDVQTRWTEEMVVMAWGPPFERRRLTGRPAERSELYVYRFEVDKKGVVRVWKPGSRTDYKMVDRFQTEVNIDDDVVTEMLRKEDWE